MVRAKTTSSMPSPRNPTACSPSPAIVATSSASRRRQLRRHRPSRSPAGPEPRRGARMQTASSSAPATPASSIPSAHPKPTNTPATCSTPAPSPASAASKSSPAPPTMKSSPAPATSSSRVRRGWSDWQPLKDGAVASPAGRFLQWKAVLHAGGELGSVAVNYLPVNAAPVDRRPRRRTRRAHEPANHDRQANRKPSTSASPPRSSRSALRWIRPAPTRRFRPSKTAPPSPFAGPRTMTTATTSSTPSISAATAKPFGACSRTRSPKKPTASTPHSFPTAATRSKSSPPTPLRTLPAKPSPAKRSATASKSTPRLQSCHLHSKGTGRMRAARRALLQHRRHLRRRRCRLAHRPRRVLARCRPVAVHRSRRQTLRLEARALRLPAFPPRPREGKTGEHLITVRVYDRHENVGVAKTVFARSAKVRSRHEVRSRHNAI